MLVWLDTILSRENAPDCHFIDESLSDDVTIITQIRSWIKQVFMSPNKKNRWSNSMIQDQKASLGKYSIFKIKMEIHYKYLIWLFKTLWRETGFAQFIILLLIKQLILINILNIFWKFNLRIFAVMKHSNVCLFLFLKSMFSSSARLQFRSQQPWMRQRWRKPRQRWSQQHGPDQFHHQTTDGIRERIPLQQIPNTSPADRNRRCTPT